MRYPGDVEGKEISFLAITSKLGIYISRFGLSVMFESAIMKYRGADKSLALPD